MQRSSKYRLVRGVGRVLLTVHVQLAMVLLRATVQMSDACVQCVGAYGRLYLQGHLGCGPSSFQKERELFGKSLEL